MRDRRVLCVLSLVALCGCAALRSAPAAAAPDTGADGSGAYVVPSRYDEGRWIVRPVLADGDTLDLYTDTAGGLLLIAREPLGADTRFVPAGMTPQGDSAFTTAWPAFPGTPGFPAPLGTSSPRVRSASLAFYHKIAPTYPGRQGVLGGAFFAHRVWVFDCPAHTLSILPAGATPTTPGEHTIPFALKPSAREEDASWFPRVRVAVDGDSLDLLFDTGATTLLTDSAEAVIHDGRPASRAASFIMKSVFDKWHARHPEWREVARAEAGTGAPMIEVPSVSVAGWATGPVWFTARADRTYTQGMSTYTDQPIVGALGGSGLRYFRIVADYPNQRATFSRPGA